jgi:diguanylate cyclase (GGDEF)-like protein
MTHLIDSVADLTDVRDKDALEQTLASVMFDLLEASTLRMWKVVRRGDAVCLRQTVRLRSPLSDRYDDIPAPRRADGGAVDDEPHAGELIDIEQRPRLKASFDAKLHMSWAAAHSSAYQDVFPVTDGREVIRLLEIARPAPLREEQERVVFGLLRIYRNHIGILDFSDCDDLTGLLNRRTFDESFRRIAMAPEDSRRAQAERRRGAGSAPQGHLAMIDIDFFKRINDRFGHPYGDEVLVLLARLMGQCFRDTDRLFRFGGEEFLVILPDTQPHEAEIALERFRASVEAFSFPQVGQVTVSIGFTAIAPGDTGSNAFGRADQALYVAKKNGRNVLRSYEDLLRLGVLQQSAQGQQDVELF